MTLTLVREDNPLENKFPDNKDKENMIAVEADLTIIAIIVIVVTIETKVTESKMENITTKDLIITNIEQSSKLNDF